MPKTRIMFVAALLATTVAVPDAGATTARLLALGAGDGFEDDALLFRWPGSARDHAGRLSLDSGRFVVGEGWAADGALPRTGPALALAWDGGASGWTGAFAAHARAAAADHAGLHRDGPGASFTWLAGRRLGDLDVAATWRSVHGGWSADDDARDEFEHQRDDFGLGTRFDLSTGAYVDLAVDLRRQVNRMQAPGETPAWQAGEEASSRSWSARARAFISLGAGDVLSIAAERLREDFGGPVIGETWDREATWAHDNRLTRVAATVTRLPDPDRMLALTAAWARATTDRSLAAGAGIATPRGAVRILEWRACAEQRLNWWLSLRASAVVTDIARGGGGADARFLDAAAGIALHLGPWGADLTAGGAPEPEAWRRVDGDPRRDPWGFVTVHREF